LKRRPNPYLLSVSVVIGALVGWLGYVITNLSCRAEQPAPAPGCPVASGIVGVVFFLVAGIGMLVVLGLTARSIAEYRAEDKRQETKDKRPESES
jgi:hypothetical protein